MSQQAMAATRREVLLVGAFVAIIALGACRTVATFVGVPLAKQGSDLMGPESHGHLRASHPQATTSSSTSSIAVPLAGIALLGMIQAATKSKGIGQKPSAVAMKIAAGDVDVINPFQPGTWLPEAWEPGGKSQTRSEWYRKVQRVGPELAVFDVTIPKPLGIKLEKFPDQKLKQGVGISAIAEGGNTDKINYACCVEDGPGMFVLEGDRVMAVDGEDCYKEDVPGIGKRIVESEGDSITLTLMRNTRKGPIRVVMLPEGKMATVKRGCRLSVAAEYSLGRDLKFGCVDGWCGTCWHRERSTNGVFKPCNDILTGDWDSAMPLALFPKPEKAGDSMSINPRGDGAA